MEVPSDYVMNIMRQAIDSRIDTLEKKIDLNHIELKTTIREFQTLCNVNMNSMDMRIKDYEQFKWKLVAFSGAVAVIAGVAAKFVFG